MKKGVLLLILLFFVAFVSAEYEGEFNVDKTEIQLGDEFTVSGSNIKFEGQNYNGNAMIILDNEENTYTLLTNIQNGEFSYETSFCINSNCILNSDVGDFDISIKLVDLQLNILHEFSNVLQLSLNDELNIILSLNEIQLYPGDKLKLEGSVFRKIDSIPVTSIDVLILIDELDTKLTLNNENFEYETILSNKIKSNYHTVKVIVEDDYGNKNNASIEFYVFSVPQSLDVEIDASEFVPNEKVKIIVRLYDQADEEIMKEVKFRLNNPKGNRMMKETVFTGSEIEYLLEEYALPGEWNIKVDYDFLEAKSSFYVKEVELLDINLERQTLVIKNVGNLLYVKDLVITARSEKYDDEVIRRTNLKPGEIIEFDLFKIFKSGKYVLDVSGTDESFEIEIIDERNILEKVKDGLVGITGEAIRSSGSGTSNIPTILMIIVFVMILVLFRAKLKRKKGDGLSKTKKKFKFPNFKKKKKEVKEFKEKILKNIDEPKSEKKEIKKEKSYSLPFGFDKNVIKEPKNQPKRIDFDKPFENL